MEAKATARYIRMSPRKVRLLADLVRGKAVDDAEVQLNITPKIAKNPLLKLLRSAKANAEALRMDKGHLYVRSITVVRYSNDFALAPLAEPRQFGRERAI